MRSKIGIRVVFLLSLIVCSYGAGSLADSTAAMAAQRTNSNGVLNLKYSSKTIFKSVYLKTNNSMVVGINHAVNDILVGNPVVADAVVRTPNKIYILAGEEDGSTNIILFGKGGRELAVLDLVIKSDQEAEQDISELTDELSKLIPGSQIKIASVGSKIALSGHVENPADIARAAEIAAIFVKSEDTGNIINLIEARTPSQVHLKVTIAEVQRTVVKQLGIDLSANGSIGDFAYSLLVNNPFSIAGAPITNTAGALSGAYKGHSISSQIRALKQIGALKTLAEPTLTAASGESAEFLVGGEFPVPVAANNDQISVEFKRFGVELQFSPVVLAAGRISLRVTTTVSGLSSTGSITLSGVQLPGLRVRRAETTVELPSGGSMVLAGLIQDDIREGFTGLPGIMDVPILGTLFKSRDFEHKQTELAIFVTPYLVKPVKANALTRPRNIVANPRNASAHLMNQLSQRYSEKEEVAASADRYHGQFGFKY